MANALQRSAGDDLAELPDPWQAAAERVRRSVKAPRTEGVGTDLATKLLPMLLSAPLRGIAQGASTMGRVARGEVDPLSSEGIQGAMAGISGALTGALPGAVPGSLGVFGGRLARTADQRALQRAMQAKIEGAKPEDVWRSTGWFQGADSEWRFEIPDSSAKVNPEGNLMPWNTTLGAVMDHPKLYAAYPQLHEMRTEITPGYGGAAMPDRIQLGSRTLGGPEIALHEAQHVIQEIEGFAKGGAPREYAGARHNELARENYLNLAGETEARNVADRYSVWRMQQRPAPPGLSQGRSIYEQVAPWESEDRSRSQQVVTHEPVWAEPFQYVGSDGKYYAIAPQSGRVHELVPISHDPFEGTPP